MKKIQQLTDRKKHILQLVITEYIRTGKPVGSKFICEEYDLGCSPATIRNELAVLEEEEYLTHPHTSAGRIPTNDGYRYYIDFLMEIQKLTRQEEENIKNEFDMKIRELDRIMQQTSKMLATVSEYAGFVIAPNIVESRISYIELVNLGGSKILLLIVTQENLVKHRVINCKYDIENLRIREIAELLNEKFRGAKISELKDNIIDILIEEQKEKELYVRFFREIIENLDNIFDNKSYYLDESPKLMENIDFEDSPYKILKQQGIIDNLVAKNFEGVQVYVGDAELNSAFKNCSLITSSYKVGNQTVGVLGIIGPKRMNYDKMVSLVEYISKLVNKQMEEK